MFMRLTMMSFVFLLVIPLVPLDAADKDAAPIGDLPRLVELTPDSEGVIKVTAVRSKDLPAFRSEARFVVFQRRTTPPDKQEDASVDEFVSTQMSILKSALIARRVIDRLKNEKLQSPPTEAEFINFLYDGLRVTRDRDPVSGSFTNVISIAFSGPSSEDCQIIVNAVYESYRDMIAKMTAAVADDRMQLISKGRDKAAQDLRDAIKQYEKIHEQISKTSPLAISDLKSRISAHETQRTELFREKVDLKSKQEIIEIAVKRGEDKGNLLIALGKMTYQRSRADDKETPEQAKMQIDKIFDIYQKILTTEILANHLKMSNLQELLDSDRETVRALEDYTLKLKIAESRVERLRKEVDDFDERKQSIELLHDLRVFAAIISPAKLGQKTKGPVAEVISLADVRHLRFLTVGGKVIDRDEGFKLLEFGQVVVLTTDYSTIKPNFLKALRQETLVLESPELASVKQKN